MPHKEVPEPAKFLSHLFEQNQNWAHKIKQTHPDFFQELSAQQAPEYLWIGCSDSRVPANEIVGLMPGELFVHRNVANVVVHSDLNCLSVLQYAIDVLKVKHIMVVGHYGCGGIRLALRNERIGLADNWLRHVQDVHNKHFDIVEKGKTEAEKVDLLCELNAIEQALSVCQTTLVQDAWTRGQSLTIHSWVYGLRDGFLRDLRLCVNQANDLQEVYDQSISSVSDSSRITTICPPEN